MAIAVRGNCMRRLIATCFVAGLSVAGCQRDRAPESAVDLVRGGAPEACSHSDVQAQLAARLPDHSVAEEITFSGFDRDQLRIRCEILQEGRRVPFEVAQNLARPEQVTVILSTPVERGGGSQAAAGPPPAREAREAATAAASRPVARGYTFDVPENYPVAFALWRRQVRGLPLEDRAWARTLTGTAGPVGVVSVEGGQYLRGWVCEPHNCGGNEAVLLINSDETRVLGLIRLTGPDQQVVDHVVGSPTAREARCLTFYLEDRSEAERCP